MLQPQQVNGHHKNFTRDILAFSQDFPTTLTTDFSAIYYKQVAEKLCKNQKQIGNPQHLGHLAGGTLSAMAGRHGSEIPAQITGNGTYSGNPLLISITSKSSHQENVGKTNHKITD